MQVDPLRGTAGVVAAMLCAGLCACAGVPDRNPAPLALTAPAFWSGEAYALTHERTPLAQWWLRFDDDRLSSAVAAAQARHSSVVAARAALQQAGALREAALAALAPRLSLTASAQRTRVASDRPVNQLQSGVQGGWSPDMSGALQRAVDASTVFVQAQEASLGAAQSAVAANVALNYIALRSAQERLAIARANLASQQETLQITQWRQQAGLIGAVEVEQAFVAAGQLGAQVSPLVAMVDNALHALAELSGQSLATVQSELTPVARLPRASADFGAGRPQDALACRADVRVARLLVVQATAQVEQASAQRYPVMDLTASGGLAAGTLSGLATGGATVSGMLLSLLVPLWDGGAAVANVRVQQGRLAQAQANYRQAASLALQEVEDTMAALRSDTLRQNQWTVVATAAGNAARMARQRFASGLVDFQTVLSTQRDQFASQDSLAQARAAVSSDQVRMYRALGGGWQLDALPFTAALPPPS